MQIAPARMMISEQTLARIGRRMKASENKLALRSRRLRLRLGGGARRLHGDRRAVADLLHPETISFSPGFRPDFTT
jgi:hypothetical protein